MAKQERLSVFDFGKQLVETNDLDPVYVMLWESKLPYWKLCDVLIAYFCFYHWKTVCWIVEQGSTVEVGGGFNSKKADETYWTALYRAASTSEFPRGTERRHYRGQQAIKSANYLRNRALPCCYLIDELFEGPEEEVITLDCVMQRVQKWVGFGSWIAFKVADVLERLGITAIQFSPIDVFKMYEAPRKGAELMHTKLGQGPVDNVYRWSYNQLIRRLGALKAPPRYERRLNIQEIETILCKWKSHMNGHYPLGKDVKELQHSLQENKQYKLAQCLLEAGHKGGLW